MKLKSWALILYMAAAGACSKKTPVSPTQPGQKNNQHISVLTQHNDNSRAGLNGNETILTTSNVNPSQFGKLFTLPVDDQIYAQPLVVANVTMGSANTNVVYIATVNNTVYAYDGSNGNLYWKKNFTASGMRPPNSGDMGSGWCSPYTDFYHNIGIVGTPVIDSAAKVMYFVARSTDGNNFVQYLHAINITSGSEMAGSPVAISASMPGTGDGSVGGVVSFDPQRNNQRMGLLLVNGVVFISYSSHCDWNPYHGWILGYDAHSLQQLYVYNDTPNGENGGIWQSGMGIAADSAGSLYVTTGNGTVGKGNLFTPSTNGTDETNPNPDPTLLIDRGESAMKLTTSGSTLTVSSYYTPTNYLNLNNNDLDYGVMGTFLIPHSSYYFTGGKDGNLYLLNKDNMGGYSSSGVNQIQQTIPINGGLHCQPAYYKGATGEFVYIWSENDQLRALSFNRGTNSFSSTQIITSLAGPTGGCGAFLSVSSNSTANGTGIVWASYAKSGDAGNTVSPGILRALDATNINSELWNSSLNSNDDPGTFSKFCPPTIANGYVYLATFSNQVVVYGIR